MVLRRWWITHYDGLSRFWTWYSSISGVLLFAALLSYALVTSFSGDGPVWTATVVRPPPSKVFPRENFVYSVSLKAHESCPGVNVYTFRSLESEDPISISFQRPVTTPGIGSSHFTFGIQVPMNVEPGKWLFLHAVSSDCPLRTKVDKIINAEIEVVSRNE